MRVGRGELKVKPPSVGGVWVFSGTKQLNMTYLAPLTRARAPVSGLPLCLYISLHKNNGVLLFICLWYLMF